MLPRGVPRPFPKRVLKKVDVLWYSGATGTLKIELLSRRELNFYFLHLSPMLDPTGSKNGPKMEPKWLQDPLGSGLGGVPERS